MTPTYYYSASTNELFGPLEKTFPEYDHTNIKSYADADYSEAVDTFEAYAHTLPSHPHAFSGESRVVPEDEIEWRYEWLNEAVLGSPKWEPSNWHHYNHTAPERRRKVAVPKEAKRQTECASVNKGMQCMCANEGYDMTQCPHYTPINESPGYTSTSGEEVAAMCGIHKDYHADCSMCNHSRLAAQPDKQNEDVVTRPPLGLMPKWRHDELRLREIQEAIDRYSVGGKEIPEEWVIEMASLKSPPSPQTGEKELWHPDNDFLLWVIVNKWEYDVESHTWCNNYVTELHGLNLKYEKLVQWYLKDRPTHQPPTAQSDQEAAEKYAERWLDKIPNTDIQDAFLAGCTHVRGQQPVDAVAIGKLAMDYVEELQHRSEESRKPLIFSEDKLVEWLVEFVWITSNSKPTPTQQRVDAAAFVEWANEHYSWAYKNKWDGDMDDTYTTEELLALFTSPPPTPKPDSQGK